ncbi:general transcription factor 3C polypeptide 3 isoform X1 [Polyodon spathula]|uniref:general transcription factor 3C polypeptide 3 isoform X1 n=1 Tax=Polyodon spathula TaxID=7913 RepID=UPI001B7E6A3B|nr:general transcription factor 3C polypeptide 3 isoform X1 [Polyodon spathula]
MKNRSLQRNCGVLLTLSLHTIFCFHFVRIMSGFSPELIDYLEGKISFEEFEKLREERKARDKDAEGGGGSEDEAELPPVEEDLPSTSEVSTRKRRRSAGCEEEGVSRSVQRAFASMLGEGGDEEDEEDDGEEDEEGDDEEHTETLSAGDVFALEIELNRENKKMLKERRHRSKLPKALRGLMGEANIRYARGDKEDAITMCMEIIRQAPLAYEPFSTLAMIYEDQGDMEKSLQFGLIAAHLNPSNREEWVKLAEMSLEQDNIKQAIFCYSKAIKYDHSNVRYLWERCSLYEQVGEHKLAMDGYRRILNLLPPSDGEHFMQLSRDMAKSYYETNDLVSAIGVMEEALAKHPSLVTVEGVNMAAELYISNKEYPKALEVMLQFCGISLERISCEEQCAERDESEEVCSVEIPEDVPVDIRVKLMVCLIHMQMLKPLDVLLTCLMEQSPEEMGDLYLDVAEAFLDIGEYNSALPLLSALVCSERYNLPVVWLRHAECLKALGHMAVAVESYSKVVEMAPLHLDARISLSTLQQQLGRPEKALEALEPMHDPDTLAQDSGAAQQELKLLLHRSTLLKSQGKMYDYVDTLLTMLAMLLKVAMNRAQVCLISSSCSGERHLYLIKVSRDKISDIDDQEAAYLDVIGKTSVLAKEDWWQLLLRSVYTLCELSRFKEAELLVDSSLEYYSFYDDRLKRKELEYFGLSAAILDKNFRKAYNYIRLMLMDNVDRPQLWNVFNQVTMQSQDVRHHRFCLRLMLKHPENHALCVLNGHNAFVSGSFKHALGQYVQAFRAQPSEPLYSLCVGLTFIHMASQKFVLKRHPLLLQGFSFLNRYLELRGPCQESFYNMGRALHQLGLVHLGIHYYQRALTCPAPHLEGIEDDQVDLRREIAYNLSLIYQSSGNMVMARHLISTYCTI